MKKKFVDLKQKKLEFATQNFSELMKKQESEFEKELKNPDYFSSREKH